MSLLKNEYFPWTTDENNRFIQYFSQLGDNERKQYNRVNDSDLTQFVLQTYNYNLQESDHDYLFLMEQDMTETCSCSSIQHLIAWTSFTSSSGNFIRCILAKTKQYTSLLNIYDHKESVFHIIGHLILKCKLDTLRRLDLFHQFYVIFDDLFALTFGIGVTARKTDKLTCCGKAIGHIVITPNEYQRTVSLVSRLNRY
jgi:hypothetical protein